MDDSCLKPRHRSCMTTFMQKAIPLCMISVLNTGIGHAWQLSYAEGCPVVDDSCLERGLAEIADVTLAFCVDP